MLRRITCFFVLISLLLLPIGAASAQDDPPDPEEMLLIQGSLVNMTTGEPGPAGVELMLHTYDAGGHPLNMIHGISGPGGAFEFEQPRTDQQLYYLVMAVYQDATHMSEAATIVDGEVPFIEVPIYETTTDTNDLQINQMHMLLGTGQGGLTVVEFYALSNLGDRTIVGTAGAGDDVRGSIEFTLPEEAANVSFPSASPDRYLLVPGGFADTFSIPPGVMTRQVVVSYVLPFQGTASFQRILLFDVNDVSILVPQQSGLQIEVSEPYEVAVEFLGPDAEAFNVTTLGPKTREASIRVVVSESQPGVDTPAQASLAQGIASNKAALLGAGALGLALIVGGIWWLKRDHAHDEHDDDGDHPEALESA